MIKKQADYDIGYGKPPDHSRFKPGRSGNPRGRPKGKRNLRTAILEELNRRVVVREGGKEREVPKWLMALMALNAQAMKGNVRAALAVLEMLRTNQENPDVTNDDVLTNDELQIIERALNRGPK